MGRWWLPVVAVLVLGAACLGGEVRPWRVLEWYLGLQRPWWQPPDWVIPLVWTGIYVLIGMAVRRAWRAAPDEGARRHLVAAVTVNLFLNGLWAVLFFVQRRPDWALAEVVALWLSIIWLMVACGRHARSAIPLLLPYLLGVSFAGVLNLALVRLNAPFP